MTMLSVANLYKSFSGLTAVKDVSFDVKQGEILGLVGPNGSGKSTTFSLIAGLHRPDAGRVTLEGRDITGLAPHHVCRAGVGRTFQIPKPFTDLTLVENVTLAAYASQNGEIDRSEAERRGIEALTLVGLPTDRHITTDGMGAAALKKLELAKAISTDPKVLLADESLGGLDTDEMRQAADLLRMLRDEKGLAIVWVEHVLGVLMSVIDRIVVLDHGEIIFEGAPIDETRDPRVVEIYLGPGAENLRRA